MFTMWLFFDLIVYLHSFLSLSLSYKMWKFLHMNSGFQHTQREKYFMDKKVLLDDSYIFSLYMTLLFWFLKWCTYLHLPFYHFWKESTSCILWKDNISILGTMNIHAQDMFKNHPFDSTKWFQAWHLDSRRVTGGWVLYFYFKDWGILLWSCMFRFAYYTSVLKGEK